MILLPRGNPVKEKIDPSKINLPQAFSKLRSGKFTGYLRFEFEVGTGIVIFEKGLMISALLEGTELRLVANNALAQLFEEALKGGATLDVYRLSPELAMSIHGLLHGDVLYRGQELKLLDIKSLLAKLKEDRLNGCLRIYTDDRIALIFYRDGSPLGFFHDGATQIETTADTSMSVARLPGAKVDVLSTKGIEELMLTDLMETADIATLWGRAQQSLKDSWCQQQEVASRSQEIASAQQRDKLRAFLRSCAGRHIGKIGESLVEKELGKVAPAGLPDSQELEAFYANLAKAVKMVAGPTKVSAMIDEMQEGAKPLLK